MTFLRFMSRISPLEWVLIIAVGWWLLRRRSQPKPDSPQQTPLIINICVGVTIVGIIGGAIFNVSWLSFVGFGSAVLGVGLLIRGGLKHIGRTIARFFR